MEQRLSYRTVLSHAQSHYRVLASKHLGFIYPIKTEAEAKAMIDSLWKEHSSANHVCFAWRIGWDYSHHRINDDGEPSGTAGKHIYGQIQSYNLTNVLIAVVRYFGGTKLGTSGLIDAYKTTSKLAIEEAKIIEQKVMDTYKISFGYEEMPNVMQRLKELDAEKGFTEFAEGGTVEFKVPLGKGEEWKKELNKNGVELFYLGRE